MTEPLTIGIGSNKWVKDANTKMITLHSPSYSGTLSLHDDTGVDYQVPVGKKLVILSIRAAGGGYYVTTSTVLNAIQTFISKSTVTDTAGTICYVVNAQQMTDNNAGTAFQPPVPSADTYIEVAAGNYIVAANLVYPTYGMVVTMTGIETDV
jgi:hypothetical protein